MHRKIPNENEVNSFVNSLFEKRDNYLKKKHLKFDKLLSYEEQHKNLNKLLNYKVINREEFEKEENKLKQIFGNNDSSVNKIGFK